MYGFDGRLTDDIWSVFDGPYRGEHQRYNSVNVQNRVYDDLLTVFSLSVNECQYIDFIV